MVVYVRRRRAICSTRTIRTACANDKLGQLSIFHLVIGVVARMGHTSPHYLIAKRKGGRKLSEHRHIVQYLCHIGFGLSYAEIAEKTNRHRASVAEACGAIEDRRDEQDFDRGLVYAETALQAFNEHLKSGAGE